MPKPSVCSKLHDLYEENELAIISKHLSQAYCDNIHQHRITGDYLESVNQKLKGRAFRIWNKIHHIRTPVYHH